MTQAELAEEMGKSRRSEQMMKYLNEEEGVIERIGSKKAGMCVVK